MPGKGGFVRGAQCGAAGSEGRSLGLASGSPRVAGPELRAARRGGPEGWSGAAVQPPRLVEGGRGVDTCAAGHGLLAVCASARSRGPLQGLGG